MTRRPSPVVVLVHLIATWFMVGLIWTIHFVHYPLFAEVGDATYLAFQAAHVDRIGKLLLLPWATEGITVAMILLVAITNRDRRLLTPAVIGALAMGVVLVVSGFWSAPAHGELADGFDPAVHDRLMTADLVRTLAWTVRGGVAVWITVLVWRSTTRPADRPNPTAR
ncbi:MAG: hypothetical protein O3C62_10905 [Actinomycetota bacterium]|nr:hypothetical protein [Actinomycetota bacterium]MDA2972795.1 hypothetical protein [Actinomycetota bacterium]MDA3002175.1 hypothetical protein [Actinomycetota bacterium]